jgi:hypothetical protein
MRPPQELLYDSEASLRLVDHAIEELNATGAELDPQAQGVLQNVMAQPGGIAVLSETLLRAYAETAALVARFRESAGMLDNNGIDKLQQMRGRLHQVSSATETAATDILDGLGRAVDLVDKLDTPVALTDAERHEMATSLRDELGGLSNHLQFQDIVSQQLVHIAALLGDMRARLAEVVSIFGPTSTDATQDTTVPAAEMQDPWTGDGDRSQAVADEIFAGKLPRKTA